MELIPQIIGISLVIAACYFMTRALIQFGKYLYQNW